MENQKIGSVEFIRYENMSAEEKKTCHEQIKKITSFIHNNGICAIDIKNITYAKKEGLKGYYYINFHVILEGNIKLYFRKYTTNKQEIFNNTANEFILEFEKDFRSKLVKKYAGMLNMSKKSKVFNVIEEQTETPQNKQMEALAMEKINKNDLMYEIRKNLQLSTETGKEVFFNEALKLYTTYKQLKGKKVIEVLEDAMVEEQTEETTQKETKVNEKKKNSKLEELKAKSKLRREKAKNEFLSKVNNVIISDNITLKLATVTKEYNDFYIEYTITKYPLCNKYTIAKHEKSYPFDVYYSKEYTGIEEVPKKHIEEFELLESNLQRNNEKFYLLEEESKIMTGVVLQGVEIPVEYAKKQLVYIKNNIDIEKYYSVHQVLIKQYIDKLTDIINTSNTSNKSVIQSLLNKDNCKIAIYDDRIDELAPKELEKLLNKVDYGTGDTIVTLKRKKYVIEVSFVDSEVDFYISTLSDYIGKYGRDILEEE